MAGECLFQTFDVDRYREILPCLDEMFATRALSAGALARLSTLLDPASERDPSGQDALRRIVRHGALAPRLFLSPRAIESAMTFVVHRVCFERDAELSLVKPCSWVLLELSLIALLEDPWFGALLQGQTPGVWRANYPRGESSITVVPGELLTDVVERLDAMRPSAEEALAREAGIGPRAIGANLDELLKLASRARFRGWALAYRFLI